MRQRKTPTTNHVFELPGGNEDNSLFVEVAEDTVGNPIHISVWEPDEEERKLLAMGATIELVVWGLGTPPVAMRLGPSMEQRKDGIHE